MRCQLFPYPEDKNIYLDWKREDSRPMPRGSTVSDGILYINDLKKEDSGEYTCFGVDAYGKQIFSAKTQLHVVGEYKHLKINVWHLLKIMIIIYTCLQTFQKLN